MADKVFAGLQLPDLTGAVARPAGAGFVRIFFYEGDLYARDANGDVYEVGKAKQKNIDKLIDDD